MDIISKEFGTAWNNPITADRVFGLIDENNWQEFKEALSIDVYWVSGECELDDSEEVCRVVAFPIGDGLAIFYTDSGRIFKSNTSIEELTDSKRHEILEYNLGKNFPKDEIVNWNDLFMHGEFIEEVKLPNLKTEEEILSRIESLEESQARTLENLNSCHDDEEIIELSEDLNVLQGKINSLKWVLGIN